MPIHYDTATPRFSKRSWIVVLVLVWLLVFIGGGVAARFGIERFATVEEVEEPQVARVAPPYDGPLVSELPWASAVVPSEASAAVPEAAPQPVPQPAPKPAAQPVAQPAPKPAPKPAPQPAPVVTQPKPPAVAVVPKPEPKPEKVRDDHKGNGKGNGKGKHDD